VRLREAQAMLTLAGILSELEIGGERFEMWPADHDLSNSTATDDFMHGVLEFDYDELTKDGVLSRTYGVMITKTSRPFQIRVDLEYNNSERLLRTLAIIYKPGKQATDRFHTEGLREIAGQVMDAIVEHLAQFEEV